MEHTEEPIDGITPGDGADLFDPSDVLEEGESELMTQAGEEAKRVVISLQHRSHLSAVNRATVYAESNLTLRADMLRNLEVINFVHFKTSGKNETDAGMRARTDSMLNRHAVFDVLFDFGSGLVPYPHYDTFRGRLVDHLGNTFSPRSLRVRELAHAMDRCGLENPSSKEIIEALQTWALEHQRDSLLAHFESQISTWDGKPRIDTLLIDLFKPIDTPLNRLFSKYFWLSLYNRINRPGSQAPVSLALIGAQDVGKSYFSVLLCRLLTGDPNIGPILLDLGAKNYNQFLRNITGKSIVANVGELMGFKKGDMNRIKEFVTKTEDELDFKFEDTIVKPRQWVTVMDGNSYEGLQRDDTGNRRFYPMFVFQAPDKGGKPDWFAGKKVDFRNFKEDLWQAMAECRKWMEENGDEGYQRLIADTNKAVSAFSLDEMDSARGVVRDDQIDNHLHPILLNMSYRILDGGRSKMMGAYVSTADINGAFLQRTRKEPYSRGLAPHMKSMGFESKQLGGRGWFFPFGRTDVYANAITDEQSLLRHIWRNGSPDVDMDDHEVDAEIAAIRGIQEAQRGF